jgi:hypothetical protein
MPQNTVTQQIFPQGGEWVGLNQELLVEVECVRLASQKVSKLVSHCCASATQIASSVISLLPAKFCSSKTNCPIRYHLNMWMHVSQISLLISCCEEASSDARILFL